MSYPRILGKILILAYDFEPFEEYFLEIILILYRWIPMMRDLLRANLGVEVDLIGHELDWFCHKVRFYDLIYTKPSLIILPAQHFQLQGPWEIVATGGAHSSLRH
jgi:hypothetical protein